jgi:hypothetical protein
MDNGEKEEVTALIMPILVLSFVLFESIFSILFCDDFHFFGFFYPIFPPAIRLGPIVDTSAITRSLSYWTQPTK